MTRASSTRALGGLALLPLLAASSCAHRAQSTGSGSERSGGAPDIVSAAPAAASASRSLEQVQREFVDLRFGMFLHFGILTYTGSWSSKPNLGWLGCVPHYHHEKSSQDGNVTSYRFLTSTDGSKFSEASAGTWPPDGRMKAATFGPTPARYLRFEIRAANGSPSVTEITVGGRS